MDFAINAWFKSYGAICLPPQTSCSLTSGPWLEGTVTVMGSFQDENFVPLATAHVNQLTHHRKS